MFTEAQARQLASKVAHVAIVIAAAKDDPVYAATLLQALDLVPESGMVEYENLLDASFVFDERSPCPDPSGCIVEDVVKRVFAGLNGKRGTAV